MPLTLPWSDWFDRTSIGSDWRPAKPDAQAPNWSIKSNELAADYSATGKTGILPNHEFTAGTWFWDSRFYLDSQPAGSFIVGLNICGFTSGVDTSGGLNFELLWNGSTWTARITTGDGGTVYWSQVLATAPIGRANAVRLGLRCRVSGSQTVSAKGYLNGTLVSNDEFSKNIGATTFYPWFYIWRYAGSGLIPMRYEYAHLATDVSEPTPPTTFVTGSDSAAAAEAETVTVLVAVSSTDAAAGSDAQDATAALTAIDSAAGAESESLGTEMFLTGSDSAVGTETQATTRSTSDADSGAAVEAETVVNSVFTSDAAVAAEAEVRTPIFHPVTGTATIATGADATLNMTRAMSGIVRITTTANADRVRVGNIRLDGSAAIKVGVSVVTWATVVRNLGPQIWYRFNEQANLGAVNHGSDAPADTNVNVLSAGNAGVDMVWRETGVIASRDAGDTAIRVRGTGYQAVSNPGGAGNYGTDALFLPTPSSTGYILGSVFSLAALPGGMRAIFSFAATTIALWVDDQQSTAGTCGLQFRMYIGGYWEGYVATSRLIPDVNAPHLFLLEWAGGSNPFRMYLDNELIYTSGTPVASQYYYGGYEKYVIGSEYFTSQLNGKVDELFIVRGRGVLTTAERDSLWSAVTKRGGLYVPPKALTGSAHIQTSTAGSMPTKHRISGTAHIQTDASLVSSRVPMRGSATVSTDAAAELQARLGLAAWTADESQSCRIRTRAAATLTVIKPIIVPPTRAADTVTLPPANEPQQPLVPGGDPYTYIRRVSITMPPPVLDEEGNPV